MSEIEYCDYVNYQDFKKAQHESLCKRCGNCCGVKDKDPCVNLIKTKSGKYFCIDYENRLGEQKTISGKTINCVPIRKILHKTWLGRNECAYVKQSIF